MCFYFWKFLLNKLQIIIIFINFFNSSFFIFSLYFLIFLLRFNSTTSYEKQYPLFQEKYNKFYEDSTIMILFIIQFILLCFFYSYTSIYHSFFFNLWLLLFFTISIYFSLFFFLFIIFIFLIWNFIFILMNNIFNFFLYF